ncbi:hypothetical protein AB6A40_002025 [Gnathostoma spinigerum]|uniref:Uncharacterized protein n=1 Tax=Gnathostoma spinigerum TaxID=75299 RepID=A0ABD6E819_9BILA
MRVLIQTIAFSCLVQVLEALRQCTCAELQPCLGKVAGLGMKCVNKCKKNLAKPGINPDAFGNCISKYSNIMSGAIDCTIKKFPNACSQTPTERIIPTRYTGGLDLAIANKLTDMLKQKGGLSVNELTPFADVTGKFTSCLHKCAEHKTGVCMKKAKCDVELPSDNVLVDTGITCAKTSGLTNAALSEACNCMVQAGMSRLAPICPKLKIF